MTATSLALLLIAAVFHALANTLLKQARDKLAFTWWMLGVSSILGLPLLFFIGHPDPRGWPIVILSGLFEAVYFASLGRAYSLGDLSQVYPVARGFAPLFVTLWALLFLNERPSPEGLLGIFSIVAGLYLVNLPSLADWKQPLAGFKRPAFRWALLTGVLISGYSTVDKVGVSYFDQTIYLYLVLCVGWIALTPQWLSADRRKVLVAEVRPDSSVAVRSYASPNRIWHKWSRLLSVVISGLLGFLAYVLVLTAMRNNPVSYVSSVREVSVVIGTWIGVKILSERGGAVRVPASCLVALGIMLIAFGG
ncbi:MAG TPA: DMT family transporter [Anaerolineae bacterium]